MAQYRIIKEVSQDSKQLHENYYVQKKWLCFWVTQESGFFNDYKMVIPFDSEQDAINYIRNRKYLGKIVVKVL